MSTYTDFENDYEQWENIETVTVRSLRADDNTKSDQVSFSKRNETRRGKVPFASENIVGETVDWHLPHKLLVNLDGVRIGDRIYVAPTPFIKDTTELWIVDECQKVRFGTEWICKAVLASASSFRHKVNVELSSTGQDTETGAATESPWRTVESNRPCWVRSADADSLILFDQEASQMSHVVFFPSKINVGTAHRFLFGTRYLAVQGTARNVDELDVLWSVPALETPRAA